MKEATHLAEHTCSCTEMGIINPQCLRNGDVAVG